MDKKRDMSALSIGEQHRFLVDKINELYPNYFEIKNGLTYSNETVKKVSSRDTHNLAILCSRILNLPGASTANIDLYNLFDQYFRNEEKRNEINRILAK